MDGVITVSAADRAMARGEAQLGEGKRGLAAVAANTLALCVRHTVWSTSVLGGYHPSRIPTRTIRDRLRIGTKTALTSTQWVSGLRVARRGAQAGVGLPTTGSSRRRSGGGLQNAEIAFRWDWYKLETP